VSATNLNVLASTITGNSATTSGGGISGGVVTLDWSTVIDNSAPVAANVAATSLSGTASVLAGPQGGGENCTVVSHDVEGFLVSDDSCGGTVLATEPVFEALADNGGPTPTRHPAPGNPVIRGYQCSEPFVLFPPPPPELTDQRGEPRALIYRLVNFDQAAWFCDVGAVEVQLTEVTVTPDPTTVVAGQDAEWSATLTVDGPYALDRFGPLPDDCTVDGSLPVPVGESIDIACDLSDRLPGSEVERLVVGYGSPYDPNHPLVPEIPMGGSVTLASGLRVICGANARTDVGPWLDPAMTWFDCDARFAEAPPATRFYPSRFLSRIAFARMLIDATPSLIPQNPNAPLADVPQKQRWIVRRVTSDPDGDGPRQAPMTGFANDEFHPSTPVSRAEVVRALWRWVGQPTGFSHDFTDVPPWVDEAVAWAAANDVVTGFPGPTFRPYETATKGMALQSLFRADTWFDAP
jgi:predicted outer membrane repeat protein